VSPDLPLLNCLSHLWLRRGARGYDFYGELVKSETVIEEPANSKSLIMIISCHCAFWVGFKITHDGFQ